MESKCRFGEKISHAIKNIFAFRTTYHCARSSEWGDRLPVELEMERREKGEEGTLTEEKGEEK